jgi:hypothetical protein
VKGGFFLGKKPLEYVLSVYTISENAIKPCSFHGPPRHGETGCGKRLELEWISGMNLSRG